MEDDLGFSFEERKSGEILISRWGSPVTTLGARPPTGSSVCSNDSANSRPWRGSPATTAAGTSGVFRRG